jgi:hypothetical protein
VLSHVRPQHTDFIFSVNELKAEMIMLWYKRKTWNYVRFKVLTSVKILLLFFSVVTACGLVGRYQRFGETYSLFLQGLPTSPHAVTTQRNNKDDLK